MRFTRIIEILWATWKQKAALVPIERDISRTTHNVFPRPVRRTCRAVLFYIRRSRREVYRTVFYIFFFFWSKPRDAYHVWCRLSRYTRVYSDDFSDFVCFFFFSIVPHRYSACILSLKRQSDIFFRDSILYFTGLNPKRVRRAHLKPARTLCNDTILHKRLVSIYRRDVVKT